MKIQYVSDLHLEFLENREFLKINPIEPLGDILVLAGDIVPFILLDKHLGFFDDLSKKFKFVYWVPGNHEYYHYDIALKPSSFTEEIKPNVFLVNNIAVVYEDVKLIFSTLWTALSHENQYVVADRLNDFRLIKVNDLRLTPDSYNSLHKQSLAFIEEELKKDDVIKKVVVTHHLPTKLNYPDKYRGDVLNEAFAVELFELIADLQPNYWIYGHHHSNVADFYIENTQLLTNQLGYVRYGEHEKFVPTTMLNI